MTLVTVPHPDASAGSMAPAEADRAGGEPLSEIATRYLRAAILDGRLRPGARLRQEAIARELGASRIPVREALRTLENEGLVNLTPRSGARVARLDYAEHAELYRIREELEPLALAESTPHLSDEALAHLRALKLQIERSRDPGVWLVLDRQFHLASYAAAPMHRLLKMIEGFWNTTQQYRRVYYRMVAAELPPDDPALPMTHIDHCLLLDALERRDASDASRMMRTHIRRTRLTLAASQHLFDE
ncbi:MAG: GntR family transcriptional regulator [Thermomicrobiales bacterium]|nr:GntR family transcriptional regulator [Thermomicrobiales bacterium]MCA9878856.1 GntR family transcriptional regulator [Thermomicrobiales bacterium]